MFLWYSPAFVEKQHKLYTNIYAHLTCIQESDKKISQILMALF